MNEDTRLSPLQRVRTRLHLFLTAVRKRLTVGVRAVLIDGRKVLLIKHTYTPGWQFPGGGVEPGESIEAALRREIREELGEQLEIGAVTPWTFRDDTRVKTYADGSTEQIYMIYLIFDCEALNRDITLNEEFSEAAWVLPADLGRYDLNAATRLTLTQKNLLPAT